MSSGSDGSTPGGDDERYLDAAGRDWGYDTILTVNLVTCTLSVVGALIMIIPFCLSKQLRKLRHQLILGMAVNDLLQSLSVLIPSAWAESHGPLAQNSPGCNADSFFYLTFVVAGCFWTLAIAMTTYITLVHPLSKTAEYMHRTKAVYVLWIGIWAVGAALNDSVDGGGFCFFPMVPPYLYGNLVLFIPRAATFTVIIGTYAALWYFFRRQASTHQRQESGLHDGTFELRMPHPFAAALSENSQPWASDQSDSRRGSGKTLNNEESDKTGINGERMAPDGLDYRGLQERLVAYRFGKCPEFPVFQATPESDSTVGAEPVRIVKGRSESEAPDSTLERNIPLKRTQSKPLQDSSQILDSPGGFEHQLSLLGLSSAATGASNEDINVERPCLVRPSAAMSHWEEGISPGATLVDSVDGTSVSGRGGDVTWLQLRSPLSEHAALDENRPQKISAGHGKKVERMSTEMSMGLWEALGSVDPDHTRDANLATAYRDPGRRLSASEENRRVSYLMLLYPLVYSIVLAFSIARLIITLIIKAHPSPWLQLLNRLLILGTGVFDACIYTIIEWRFRASSQAAARTSFSKSESQSRRASASA